jgi:putative acetyltransferase
MRCAEQTLSVLSRARRAGALQLALVDRALRSLYRFAMSSDAMNVRRARPTDRPEMLELWERSVRATHHFLSEQDILELRPLVAELFQHGPLEFWVVVRTSDKPLGFLGYAAHAVEALFIDPAERGRGAGKLLMAHAQSLSGAALSVDVNEQNEGAVGFYRAQGFEVVSRSELDAQGRPFPTLHMRRDR